MHLKDLEVQPDVSFSPIEYEQKEETVTMDMAVQRRNEARQAVLNLVHNQSNWMCLLQLQANSHWCAEPLQREDFKIFTSMAPKSWFNLLCNCLNIWDTKERQ